MRGESSRTCGKTLSLTVGDRHAPKASMLRRSPGRLCDRPRLCYARLRAVRTQARPRLSELPIRRLTQRPRFRRGILPTGGPGLAGKKPKVPISGPYKPHGGTFRGQRKASTF